MTLHQKASFGSEACETRPKVPIWGIRWTGFPPEDSPFFYRASTEMLAMKQNKDKQIYDFVIQINAESVIFA